MARPPIPMSLRRQVLVEAGHRCAIPTCRYPTAEIAHIEPYAKVRKHEYHNLIALCPNCHTRFDRGEIDRLSMGAYKRKITYLSDRYSRFELNVVDYLRSHTRVNIHGVLQVKALVDDGLIANVESRIVREYDGEEPEVLEFLAQLTDRGRAFVKAWRDPDDDSLTYERDGA